MVEVSYVVKPSTVGWVEQTSSFGVRGKEIDKLHQSPSDRRTNGIVRCDQLFISYKKANEKKGDDKITMDTKDWMMECELEAKTAPSAS